MFNEHKFLEKRKYYSVRRKSVSNNGLHNKSKNVSTDQEVVQSEPKSYPRDKILTWKAQGVPQLNNAACP